MNPDPSVALLCENIDILSMRGEGSERQREICIGQLIDRLCASTDNRSPEVLYREFCATLSDSRASDRARFCEGLTKTALSRNALSPATLFASSEDVAPGSHGKVALVRNRYNEEAYRHFSDHVMGAKPYYLPSFTDTCEDVFDNRSEFCILPIENTQDGKLFGFYTMLDRYELKICAACDLETDTPTGRIRYALVGRGLPRRIPKRAEWMFECSIVQELGNFPNDVLQVASLFNATLTNIDSLPVLYDDGLQRFYFAFRIPEDRATALHLYLTMEHARYTFIGFYPKLKVSYKA